LIVSESEKLQQTIAEFESEVAGLTADVADLEQRLVVATSEAEQAIAAAERRADDDAQSAAVDAEQERQRLAQSLSRKKIALQAATNDLATARHGLAAARWAARFVQLQSLLDEIGAAAVAIDGAPMVADGWATLKQLTDHAQNIYREAGGRSTFVDDPAAIRARLWSAHAVIVDAAMGSRGQSPTPIPTMATLLGLDRAAGLLKELMGAN
jgi:predicted  nucleic acid-binding Zn-ribbon protein